MAYKNVGEELNKGTGERIAHERVRRLPSDTCLNTEHNLLVSHEAKISDSISPASHVTGEGNPKGGWILTNPLDRNSPCASIHVHLF